MSKSSHSQQREPGLQGPMRPITAEIELEDGFTMSEIVSNWTTADQIMNVRLTDEFFDDKSRLSVDAADDIQLPPGVWALDLCVPLTCGAASRTGALAVTNTGGSVIYGESPVARDIEIDEIKEMSLRVVVHVPQSVSGGAQEIQIRGRASGAALTVVDEEFLGVLTKIGNADET